MNCKKLLLFLVAPLMLAFAGCEPTPQVQTFAECSVTDAEGNAVTTMAFGAEQESATFTVTATRSWTITTSLVSPADIDEWFAVAPKDFVNADNSSQSKEITVSVFANEGEARTATLSIDYGDDKPLTITISQSGKGQTALGEEIFYDNFDKVVAAKEGSYWPNMDAKYGNPTPESQSGVTYASNNITVRSNSPSNSSYSDYPGSGSNNLFFGKVENYVTINGISLAALEGNALTLTFGSEKYTQDGDSTFKNEEFSVAISADGQKWTNLNYTFAANANLSGRWNLATAQFNLKEVPATVSLRFSASVASVYRLDDVKLTAGGGGAEIDLSQGTDTPGGSTGGGTTEPVNPGEIAGSGEGTEASPYDVVRASDIIAKGAATSTAVYTKGIISQIDEVSTSYGNATYYISNDGSKTNHLTVFRGKYLNNEKFTAADQIKVGDEVVVLGVLELYNGSKAEITNSYIFSHKPGEGGGTVTPEPEPEPTPGVEIPEGAVVWNIGAANQTWAAETDATLGAGFAATVNNLKVGYYTHKSGNAVVAAKDDHIRVYKTSALVITPLDGRKITQVIMLCTDPYNTSIYTWNMNVSDGTTAVANQDAKYITWSGNTDKFEAYADNGQVRIKTLAVVLEGEGSGTVTPDPTPDPEPEPEPEPTPGDFATIASVLALGQNATVAAGTTIEGVVISNMDLNNLTSKKGMYVQDATGALQFYLAANHEFAFGDKVQIDLGGATVGAYNGAVQISGLALDKITKVSSGNTVEAKTVSIADFLANKYEGQYVAIEGVQVVDADLSKTWVMGGAHTSINMEDANGNKFVVFSSKYATYGASTVAQGSGTIKGISSINNGNIQIIFAQDSDYAGLTGARLGGGTVTPEPEEPSTPDTPATGEWAGRDDFATVGHNSSYTARQTTAGWVATFCAVQSGGASDANPVLPSLLGSDPNTRAFCILANSTQVGTITSPVLTTGCGKLKFTYALAFTDKNGIDMTVEIKQNGATVKSFAVVNTTCAKYDVLTFEEEVNVAGDFQIVFTNNGPSKAASGNKKDRVSIWDIMWTAAQ